MVMCMMNCNCTMQCHLCVDFELPVLWRCCGSHGCVRPADGSTPLPQVIHKANRCAESVLVLALNLPQQCVGGLILELLTTQHTVK